MRKLIKRWSFLLEKRKRNSRKIKSLDKNIIKTSNNTFLLPCVENKIFVQTTFRIFLFATLNETKNHIMHNHQSYQSLHYRTEYLDLEFDNIYKIYLVLCCAKTVIKKRINAKMSKINCLPSFGSHLCPVYFCLKFHSG